MNDVIAGDQQVACKKVSNWNIFDHMVCAVSQSVRDACIGDGADALIIRGAILWHQVTRHELLHR